MPRDSVVSVRRVREGARGGVLRIERTDGPPIELVIGNWPLRQARPNDWTAERVGTVYARLRDLVSERPPLPETVRMFETASSAHVEALRSLARKLPTFRETPLTVAELAQIVASDETPAHLRARAAVVIGALSGRGNRALLRVANATAHPALRVAVIAVAEGAGDEVIQAALEELEKERSAG